jgi:hypothetical protein
VSNSCVQLVLVGEAEGEGGMLEPEWGQHLWFHLRCDCDVMEMHRQSCSSFPYERRSSMPNVRLRPMCGAEERFSLDAGKKNISRLFARLR